MASQSVVFIEGSRTGGARAAAIASISKGFETIILSKTPTSCDYLADLPVTIIPSETQNVSALHELCTSSWKHAPIAGVGSTSEYYVEVSARLANMLQLPGPPVEAVQRCRSKSAARLALRGSGLNPQFIPVSDAIQVADFAEFLVYPVIIKPVSLTGSMLVTLCRSAGDLFAAWSRIESYFVERRERPTAIVESFVAGTEYSVELMHGRALGITTKHLADGEGFVEVGFEFPAPLPTPLDTLLTESAERALQRIGLTWGPAHVEIKIDGVQATIIEINARMGGLRTAELIGLSGGINFAGAYVDALTGSDPDVSRRPSRAAAVHYRRAPTGRAQMLSLDTSAAVKGAGVEEVFAFDKVGKVYETTGSNWDIAYGAIAVGQTPEEAGRAALLALDEVVVTWGKDTNA